MRSSCCLCVCVPHRNVATQRLVKQVSAITNTHATTELLDVVFSMWSVSYQIICSERKVLD
jgi:hypothetical protein